MKVVPILLALVVAVAARPSFADDASDRERDNYLREIDSKLESAASELSGFESDSDASDLDDAANYVGQVRSLVGQLDRVKGDDSKAREVVDRYPRFISDYETAAKELRFLKSKQRTAAELVRQCKAFDTEMTDRARATKDDPRGAEELSDFAKSVGRKGEDLMNEAARLKSDLERSRDEARRFSADHGEWRDLRDAVHRAAVAMVELWVRDYDQARRDCEEVVKRERHREIEKVLGQLANSRAGRADLRKRLDEMLALIQSKITDVQGHSSTSEVNGAVELTKQVDSLLERLKSAAGDDESSRTVAANWPAWSVELRASLEALRAMKEGQYRADKGGPRCAELEAELQATIRGFVGAPAKHKEGLAQLPGLARALGNEWRPKLEAAAQGDYEMEQLYSKAKYFSRSDAPWGDLRSRTHASADGVRSYWKDKYGAAKAACTNLALGEQHPDVVKAMAEMQVNTTAAGESYRALRVEFNRWDAEVDKLRDWSKQDAEDIRKAFCAAPDAGDYDEVYAVADRWSRQLTDQWGTINGQGDRIKARAQELISRGRALKNGPKVITGVDTILASMEKIKEHQLKGSNDPMLKARADYGVAEHTRRQGNCTAKEVPISGCRNPHPKRTDCKMDCVIVSGTTCTIVEIKPDSAEALGEKQAEAYFTAVKDLFEAKKAAGFTGGLAVFKQCVSEDGEKLNLAEPRVDAYDFCNGLSPVGVLLTEVNVSIPEEEE